LFSDAFAVVFNLFLTPGTPVITLWKLSITEEGIRMALKMAVRLTLLIIGSSLMTLTTTPNHLYGWNGKPVKALEKAESACT